MIAGLQQMQRGAPNKVIVMTAVLERLTDDMGRVEWRVQLEGDKTARSFRHRRSHHCFQLDHVPRRCEARSRFRLLAERLWFPRKNQIGPPRSNRGARSRKTHPQTFKPGAAGMTQEDKQP